MSRIIYFNQQEQKEAFRFVAVLQSLMHWVRLLFLSFKHFYQSSISWVLISESDNIELLYDSEKHSQVHIDYDTIYNNCIFGVQ
jgi:hypothetical protein